MAICRLCKRPSKVTRLKKSAKATGLPAEGASADEQAALSTFIEKKRKRAALRKGRGRKRVPDGKFV